MYIGYARVSTQDQHLDLQQDALRQAGCTKIIVDRVSGTVTERPGLATLKEILTDGHDALLFDLALALVDLGGTELEADNETLRAEAEGLRDQLETLGPVNALAIAVVRAAGNPLFLTS